VSLASLVASPFLEMGVEDILVIFSGRLNMSTLFVRSLGR